ncbi:MAG TPA: tetratricopeptide repeat protein [Chthoniobacterales bacterium]|nr:tetratricopeptide repeat protein [Chthoniobacterales bacterium]
MFAVRLFGLTRLSESQFLLPTGGDMQFYNDWALRIVRGSWTEHTAFYGLPLYAYLLAGIYKICGYSPFVPGLLQAALEGGTAVLLYKLAILIFGGSANAAEKTSGSGLRAQRGQMVGILAAVGWAFFQPAQGYSIILMPTAGLVFVFWFVVWQIVKRTEAPGWWRLFLLGALMGFTAMGIATILFLVPLVLAALFIRWHGTLTRRLAGAGLVLAGVLLGAAPAAIHNFCIARDPVFLSAHSGVNFWIGNNPVATGYPKFPPGLHAGQVAMLQDSINAAEEAAGRPLKRSEVSAYWSEKGRDWIVQHPLDFIKLLGIKTRNFWNAYQYDDLSIISTLREQGIIFPGLAFGLVAAIGIPGMLLASWRFRSARWLAVAVLLHMAALLTVFVTERYRLAAVPGLTLFAAFGLLEFWRQLANARYREAAVFVLLLFGATAFVSLPQKDDSLWALDSYNSGLGALKMGQLAVAKRKLDLAYAYSPRNAEVNFAEGNLSFALGDRAAAKWFYVAALRLDSRHDGCYNNLGVLALQEKDWARAANLFGKAVQYDPRSPKTHYLLAQARFKNGDLHGAQTEISKALKLNPRQVEFVALQSEISKTSSDSQ